MGAEFKCAVFGEGVVAGVGLIVSSRIQESEPDETDSSNLEVFVDTSCLVLC